MEVNFDDQKKMHIAEIDESGSIIAVFPSQRDAAEFYKFNPALISLYITGKTKHAKGHRFKKITVDQYEDYVNHPEKLSPKTPIEPELIKYVPDYLPATNVTGDTPEITTDNSEQIDEMLTPFEKMLKKYRQNLHP